jgi:hypothetical protein
LRRKVLPGVDAANHLVVHQQYAFQDPVLPHQVLIRRDVIVLWVPFLPAGLLGQQRRRNYYRRSRELPRGTEEGTPVQGMVRELICMLPSFSSGTHIYFLS